MEREVEEPTGERNRAAEMSGRKKRERKRVTNEKRTKICLQIIQRRSVISTWNLDFHIIITGENGKK